MPVLRGLLFLVGASAILLISRPVLRRPGSHGYYRTFAFILILALILWVIDRWFADPFSPLHILSWVLLFAALFLVVTGFAHLLRRGRPQGSFEDTTVLVTSGVYRFIRHPLYASLLYLAWGAFLKQPGWVSAALVIAATFFLWHTARAEEAENLAHFGPEYADYMRRSRRFVPFVF